jgi:uracil-DNA glycosylase
MSITPDMREELRTLLVATRAQLEFERACGSSGIQLGAHAARPEIAAGAEAITETVRVARAVVAEHGGAAETAARNLTAQRSDSIASEQPPSAAVTSAATTAVTTAGITAVTTAIAPEERVHRLEIMAREAASCTACVLHEKRKHNVFARGSAMAELAFVGEGPGRDEDLQGLPFVGAAGQLLDRMIAAMGYGRDDVYICNVVKCRPPENRTPRPEEMLACSRYLVPQLEIVAPKYVVALGRCAAQALGVADVTGPWRGRFGVWRGIPVMPTYHPAFLLRSPEFKRVVWEDLQQVMGRLGRQPKRPTS